MISEPIFAPRSARVLIAATFVTLALVQAFYLVSIDNGLGALCDGFSEANALRAGEAFARDGLTSFHGLPRQLFGRRFPHDGMVIACLQDSHTVKPEYRVGFPAYLTDRDNWVYSHYPPGPDYLL